MLADTSIVVMCGGRGSRLGAFTKDIPKPLVEVHNKPILEWKLEHYSVQNYNNFVLCIGSHGEKIRKYIHTRDESIHIHDSGVEAGILKRLIDVKQHLTEFSIVTYGDTFAKIDLDSLVKSHASNQTLVTLVVAPIINPFGILKWNNKNIITEFEEKPTLNHFIGYFVINREALELLPQKIIDMPDGEGIVSMFQIFISMKQAKIYEYSGLKFTINTPSELEDAKKNIGDFYTLNGE